MKCVFKGNSILEITVNSGFNGENISELTNNIADKSLVDQVYIFIDENAEVSTIKNFSIFFRTFFTDYPNITCLTADTCLLGVYETFKDFQVLVDNYKNKNCKYGQELFLLDLGTMSQRNCPQDKGIKYFLENIFGSGFLKHICKINIEIEGGIHNEKIYDSKESFENLSKLHKNLENIPNIHDSLNIHYFRIEN